MREHKGDSIIDFLSDYTVIDIETTGLSPKWDEIIELGAIRYRDRKPVAEYDTLVKCSYPLDSFITNLTGITNEMMEDAPLIADVIKDFYDFVGNDIVIGNNVSFDINFIYDACIKYLDTPFSNDHINTIRFSRKLFPELPSRRLTYVCDALNIPTDGAHRALRDCELTNEIYCRMLSMIDDQNAFLSLFKRTNKHRGSQKAWNIKDIVADPNYEPNEDSDIYGMTFCFTGKLDAMPRKEAAQIVVNMGGELSPSVNRKTNYLVLGSTDYCKTIKNGKTQKQKKAEQLQEKGFDISVITEDVFYQMIEE